MKAKGLIVKNFPHHWTNWINPDKPNEIFTKEEIEFNNKLIIEKRPYFMKYLYPTYKMKFNEHYNKYEYLCYRTFGIHIEELLNIENKTEEQKQLANNYNKFNPLLETDCVMNNICRYMEKAIKEIKINVKKASPDYIFNILYNPKIDFTEEQMKEMLKVYKKYKASKSTQSNIDMYGEEENKNYSKEEIYALDFDYISDDIQRLANIAIYINYVLYPKSPKNFCWDLFGEGILLNIYDNSNKEFSIPMLNENGKIEITLEKRDGNLYFAVTDDGIGIAEEDKDKIFNMFFTGDKSHNKEGSGLGLPLTKTIVEKLSGEINFSSMQGKGTTFIVTLPL